MIKNFLNSFNLEEVPLLLGLSGGPDSTALMHILLELNHPFQVAHIDHGWRPESASEAAEIVKMCEKWGIGCHIRSLKLEGPNLEDLSRQARHRVFREICLAEGLEGVVLGHHADDQAETVLKRVFEGASLPKLQGLASKTQIGDLTLYRPLLSVRKEVILEWLEERKIPYFTDPTNLDTRFLRNRMRARILPTLSDQFGKQIEMNLCRLGEQAAELSAFLQIILKPFRDQVVDHDEWVSLDFKQFSTQSPFIYKAVVRDFFEQQRLTLSKSVMETLLFHLQKNNAHKTIQVGQKQVEIHRGNLTIRKLKLFSL